MELDFDFHRLCRKNCAENKNALSQSWSTHYASVKFFSHIRVILLHSSKLKFFAIAHHLETFIHAKSDSMSKPEAINVVRNEEKYFVRMDRHAYKFFLTAL